MVIHHASDGLSVSLRIHCHAAIYCLCKILIDDIMHAGDIIGIQVSHKQKCRDALFTIPLS